MIPVEQINEQELEKRFGVLPDKLKEALDSARNNKIIDGVCRNHHLVDEDKILSIRQIVGIVLFGYMHSYDVASELNEWLELNNPQLAASIAQELDVKIFSPLKTELESNYHPLPSGIQSEPAGGQPVPMPFGIAQGKPAQMPTIISDIRSQISDIGDRKSEARSSPSPAPFDTAPSTQLGINQGKPKPLGDLPTAPVSPATPKPPDGLATLPTASSQPRIPSPPAFIPNKIEGPAPFMIHKEAEFKPLQPKKDAPRFDASLKMWSEAKPGAMPIPRPARVDLGRETNQEIKKSTIGRTENPEAKIIHYSQWTTPPEKTGLGASTGGGGPVPLSQISSAPTPNRQQPTINNIAQKPPAPFAPAKIPIPVPPSPPKSVLPTVPQVEKKIVPPVGPSKLPDTRYQAPDTRFTPIDLTKLAPFDIAQGKPKASAPSFPQPATSPRIPEPPQTQISDFRSRISETPPKPPAPPREVPKQTGGNVIDLSKLS